MRLRDDEWILAEAIGRMNGEHSSGFGIRTALKLEENRLMRGSRREELVQMINTVTAERASRIGDR